MRFLRLLFAGLIALIVVVGGLMAAALVVLTGMVGLVVQRLQRAWGMSRPVRPPGSTREPPLRTDDVIDI